MFNKLRIGKRGENIIFSVFVLIYIAWCVSSPDMNIESLKSVLTIGCIYDFFLNCFKVIIKNR